MKRKARISLMIVMLMILSSFTALNVSSTTPNEEGIVTFEKTVWDQTIQEWTSSIHNVLIGDTVSFKLTITYAVAGYHEGVKLSLKKIKIYDNLPYGLEYINGSSTVDGTFIAPEINDSSLYWNLTDSMYNLDENESHSIEFNALVVYSNHIQYVIPETKIKNHAHATSWECGQYYYHENCATAKIYVKNNIEVKKEVWNGNEWIKDDVDGVILGEKLSFKITITYYGPYVLDEMTVTDYLPCCLEYADESVITGAEYVAPTVGEGCITWQWENNLGIGNGGTITITYDTEVMQYCGYEQENLVEVTATSYCHENYQGSDYIYVNCVPPAPTFEKKVWDQKEGWAESTNAYLGDDVTFMISLTYYGTEPLENIVIVDQLPCCLEYADDASLAIKGDVEHEFIDYNGDVSADERTVTWDLENVSLADGDVLIIQFNALAVDITSPCGCNGINTATYSAYSDGEPCCYEGGYYEGSDTASVKITEKPAVPPVTLSIKIKPLSIGKIIVKICNTGETDVNNLEWNITVNAKRKGFTVEGSSGTIGKDDCVTISTGKRSIKRILGKVQVTVTVNVPGYEPFTTGFYGFVFGRLFLDQTVRAF